MMEIRKEKGERQIRICNEKQEKINSNALFILIANEKKNEKTKKYKVKNE